MPNSTPDEIVNEIEMRQIHSRIYGEGEAFVLVEGKTDQVLWEEYRSVRDCTLYPAKGKDKIIAALSVSKNRGVRGIAGIVDLDYWLITDADELGIENLLFDECCPDMESLLLDSPALRKVLRHSIDTDDFEQLHEFADTLAREAQRLAMEFGYFRLLNHLKDYGLKCNAIDFAEVIDIDTLELDEAWVAKRLSEDAAISSEELLNEVLALKTDYPPDNVQLCRGKDIVAIMTCIFPILFKSEFGEDLSQVAIAAFRPKGLSKDLRMAYEYGYFRETSLYSCIRKWESDNRPFRIIKQYDFERTRDV